MAAALFGGAINGIWVNPARVAIGVVAGVVLILVIYNARVQRPSVALGKPSGQAPANREIAQAYSNAVSAYSKQALGLLVKMLIELPNYLERINEDVVLEEEIPQLEVATRQVYRIGATKHNTKTEASKLNSLLVPLLFVQKGTLLDGFVINDAHGREVPTLSYNQTRGLLAYAIHTIIRSAPQGRSSSGSAERKTNSRPLPLSSQKLFARRDRSIDRAKLISTASTACSTPLKICL